ncbi:ATP-binding protein [Pseudohaliea rubra]|uniref:histidine kinase n=1 Tax=Pseudohaliea rubra DSM 19751 TaxID=1265313 RepID=A0A095XSR9_9GAMM|nr:ATP-binding protein [Pseudohaliea rubra]KGE02711.1 Two-component sensor CbrA: intrcellular carbon:nitrogen balance [Pseudohaliea rubra DSM 19751]
MSFSPDQVLLAIIAYLSVLFLVGYFGDRGAIPARVIEHPATYVLSLGVIGGGMASNGVFTLAALYGHHYLLYYLGIALMFLLAVLLLRPILRLCRVHQLASLADLLAFRFRSPWVGAAVTLAMCATLLPLLALQIRTVADSIHHLAGGLDLLPGGGRRDGLALLFCVIITVFTILFGTRNATSPNRNPGLVAAIAFESLVKLGALMLLMAVALGPVFGGFGGLGQWLLANPGVLGGEESALPAGAARLLLLLFFAGAVCMPHIFHMAFAENSDSRHLRAASWGLPLYLLLLALPVLPILWGAVAAGSTLPASFAGLGLGAALGAPWVSGVAFVAGLSAASAVIVVATLALANMCLNYLVLPNRLLRATGDHGLYRQLKWFRRSLITALILGGYAFFTFLGTGQSLPELGFLAFSGTLQFLPAVIATPYWPRANRGGLLAGLALGLAIWFLALVLPVLSNNTLGITASHSDDWTLRCMLALLANTAAFIIGSLLTRRSREEEVAAEICSMDSGSRPHRRTLPVNAAADFVPALARALGEDTARAELDRALRELRFEETENRPYALRHLRSRIEANLSGMLGPALALEIVDRCLPYSKSYPGEAGDFALLEQRLEKVTGRFTGLAADLDYLRRHYRQTLEALPVGLCSLGVDGEVLLWNRRLAELTGIAAAEAVGARWTTLAEPWHAVFAEALAAEPGTLLKRELAGGAPAAPRWITLHCSAPTADADRLLLVEDITDYQLLQDEVLHNERLASIGRLAAGVAHEIGNPITGIACLAQNLAASCDPAEVRETADDILTQTGRVSRIVESLVNFSHLGSGAGDTRLEPCNLADCVDEAISLLSLDRDARPVAFVNDCRRDTLVLADCQRLLQVFINLLGNARDASGDGAAVTVGDTATGGSAVEIHVDDCGQGIAPELLPRVFEPFFTTKEPGRGTGLGLPLVYSILEDMGGSVRIESPGPTASARGTRVTLALRAAHYDAAFAGLVDTAGSRVTG